MLRIEGPVLLFLLVGAGCGTSAGPGGSTCADCSPGVTDGTLPADRGLPAVDGAAAPDSGAAMGDAGIAYPYSAIVHASTNLISWKSCGPTPAQLGPLAPGSYTIALDASTLSKGGSAKDDYVIAELPVGESKFSYVSLNGVKDSFDFTTAQQGSVRLWFIDSDGEGNSGQATVEVQPGGLTATVSATDNLIEWEKNGCGATPAEMSDVPVGSYTIKLLASSLTASGDLVVVRLPLEVGNPSSFDRYVVLNGVGDSLDFSFKADSWGVEPVRVWYISEAGTAAGQATVVLE